MSPMPAAGPRRGLPHHATHPFWSKAGITRRAAKKVPPPQREFDLGQEMESPRHGSTFGGGGRMGSSGSEKRIPPFVFCILGEVGRAVTWHVWNRGKCQLSSGGTFLWRMGYAGIKQYNLA